MKALSLGLRGQSPDKKICNSETGSDRRNTITRRVECKYSTGWRACLVVLTCMMSVVCMSAPDDNVGTETKRTSRPFRPAVNSFQKPRALVESSERNAVGPPYFVSNQQLQEEIIMHSLLHLHNKGSRGPISSVNPKRAPPLLSKSSNLTLQTIVCERDVLTICPKLCQVDMCALSEACISRAQYAELAADMQEAVCRK